VITTTEVPDARAAAGIPAQPAPTTTTTTRPVITIPPVTTRPQR
jgi:serine/threonine-protein kinase